MRRLTHFPKIIHSNFFLCIALWFCIFNSQPWVLERSFCRRRCPEKSPRKIPPPGKLPPGNIPPRKSPPWGLGLGLGLELGLGVRGRNPSNPNLVTLTLVTLTLVALTPGGTFPRGTFPRGIFPGGSFPGGTFPGGGLFLEPSSSYRIIFWYAV